MPRYNKKITSPMEYPEFKSAILELPIMHQAFLTLLFFAGCRISEAVALTSDNINCTADLVFFDFFRLKGSKQTDPQPIPKTDAIVWFCSQEGKIFPFSRFGGERIVKKAFPHLYPHYFRANRIVKISEKFGDATVYATLGICARSIDHYRQKVDIKKVGKALWDEVK